MKINIEDDKVVFILKSSAIVINGHEILLTKLKNGDFWFLPGMSINALESSVEALKRLFKDNLNAGIEKQEFIWILETFYKKDDQNYHEINFHYLIDLAHESYVYKENYIEGLDEKKGFVFQWYDLNDLDKILLLPLFIKSKIKNGISNEKEHIILLQNN